MQDVSFDDIDWNGNCANDTGRELRACNIITNGTAMLYDLQC